LLLTEPWLLIGEAVRLAFSSPFSSLQGTFVLFSVYHA
jgi:hypothetical protein